MQFNDGKKTYEIEFVEIGGVIEPEAKFTIRTIAPALGTGMFDLVDLRTVRGTTGIEFSEWTEIAKAACGGKQRVLYSISPEAVQHVKDLAAAEIEKFRQAAAAKEITTWEYAFGGDTWKLYLSPAGLTSVEAAARADVVDLVGFAERNRAVNEYLAKNGARIERDSGLYTRDGWKMIGNDELQAVVAEARAAVAAERATAEAERQAKFDAALKQAQETGKPVVIRVREVECNDPREECDCDHIVTYVHPDGTTSTARHHTW
ncbi:MAG: hypothetical protein WC129_03025 [Sphaerochaetaceae bacterium]